MAEPVSYAAAIREAFGYLLKNYPKCFCIGQGLWSPWYVGQSMKELEVEFGKNRVIDTPISEWATTGAALGASLFGYRPIVIHPRMDFMVLASDPIVNQAAKWSHMFGGQANAGLTIRAIINRRGEQGAQHSQALHSWYAHIPGLRVVMPATVADARDLLIGAVLCDDPVLYIDDRDCYHLVDTLAPVHDVDLTAEKPKVLRQGTDISLVGSGFSTQLCLDAAETLAGEGINAEVVDLRVLNPLDRDSIRRSVEKTGALLAVDGGWLTCGMAGEVVASMVEAIPPSRWRCSPQRVVIADAPAPTSKPLEDIYYPTAADVAGRARAMLKGVNPGTVGVHR